MKANEIKKFTTKSFIQAIIDDIHNMDIKDVETMFDGIRLFNKIVNNYMKDRYGSSKRLSDLKEYEYILGETLMAKYYEVEKQLLEEIGEVKF